MDTTLGAQPSPPSHFCPPGLDMLQGQQLPTPTLLARTGRFGFGGFQAGPHPSPHWGPGGPRVTEGGA